MKIKLSKDLVKNGAIQLPKKLMDEKNLSYDATMMIGYILVMIQDQFIDIKKFFEKEGSPSSAICKKLCKELLDAGLIEIEN